MTDKILNQPQGPPGAVMDKDALQGLKVGFALTGSHCTLASAVAQISRLSELGADVYPIISESVKNSNTRFGTAADWQEKIKKASGKKEIIDSIVLAEPIGPQNILDLVIIAPCSGNTLAKLVNGITDSPVLMAAKANLRNNNPLIIAVSTNDGLSGNARNIGQLMNIKNIFFVPFGQDSPYNKPNSLIADLAQIPETIIAALQKEQVQPVFLRS